eukprot:g41903.t1
MLADMDTTYLAIKVTLTLSSLGIDQMWEIREQSNVPENYICRTRDQLQLLIDHVVRLEKQLDTLQGAERVIDTSFREGVAKSRRIVGDSIVRGTDRNFCGRERDSRMMCCLISAKILDVFERVQDILKREGKEPEVIVHIGTNDI